MLIILGFVQACYYIFIDPKSVCNTCVQICFSFCKEVVAWFTTHGFVSVEENEHYFKMYDVSFQQLLDIFFLWIGELWATDNEKGIINMYIEQKPWFDLVVHLLGQFQSL